MQVIATILAVFFMSLTVLPCTDEATEECSTEIHFHAAQGHEQDAHADFCSPFCACHCCHAHFLVKDFTYHSTEIANIGTHIPYISHQYPPAPHTIWQPPRV